MIPHSYVNASDNIAQAAADLIGRQEVTLEWYLEHMIDFPICRWTSDEEAECGLDPWRVYDDLPIDPEEVEERGWRLFVQRRNIPLSLRDVAPIEGSPVSTNPDAYRQAVGHVWMFGNATNAIAVLDDPLHNDQEARDVLKELRAIQYRQRVAALAASAP